MELKEFKVGGMTCQHCVKAVNRGVSKLSGVSKVDVSLEKANAVIEYDSAKLSSDDIVKKVTDLGYQCEL